jgi:hypothetical protein
MTNPVQIAHAAPTMASTAAINERHELGNRVIVVHPTPGSGGEGIARDVLQALGKRFRDRSPRDPQRLRTLAGIWLRAEQIRELVIARPPARRRLEDPARPLPRHAHAVDLRRRAAPDP